MPIALIIFSHSAKADHASISFETGTGGAIMTTSGSTLPKGKRVIGIGAEYLDLEEIADTTLEAIGAANEEAHSVESLSLYSVNFAYGLTDQFTIGLKLSYLERSNVREAANNLGVGEVEAAGDSKGIGDLSLFSNFRFYHDENKDIAFISGIKVPTGETEETETDGAKFEVEQQPGSGSWDPFLGIGFNQGWKKFGVSSNFLYTFVTEGARDTDLGDILNYNVAMTYRMSSPEGKHDHHRHKHALNLIDYVDLIIELNGDYRERVEISGVEDTNTGGHTLYISPGVRIGVGHSWSIYSSVGIPIVNELNGVQSEPEYRFIGGISTTF